MSNVGLYQSTVQLPSMGKIYPSDACPTGSVTIRALTTEDESFMQQATKDNAEGLMNKMVGRCIVGGWNTQFGRMSVADRIALLYQLRILTHGGAYLFDIGCPRCGEDSTYTIDLSKMPVTYLADGVAEPIFTDLPMCGKRVGWRFLRVDDESDALTYKRQQKQRGLAGSDPTLYYQFARRIVSVDGDENIKFDALLKFAKTLHSRDRITWEHAIDAVSFGFETELEVTCRECGKNHVTGLPVSDDFFRPSYDYGLELSAVFSGGNNVAYDPNEAGTGPDHGDAHTVAGDANQPVHPDHGGTKAEVGAVTATGSGGTDKDSGPRDIEPESSPITRLPEGAVFADDGE